MATEMTLGRLIKNAFFDYQTGGKEGRAAAEIQLRALAARADAAERLAKADVAVCDAADAMASLDRPDRIQVKREWNTAKAEHGDARAAWRAITKGEVAHG